MLSGLEDHGVQTTCKSCQQTQDTETETKSGQLYMVQKCNKRVCKLPVRMSAYKNGYGHYAVVNADKTFTNKSIHINLKNCILKHNKECEITLITNNGDGNTVIFQTEHLHETTEWMAILQKDSSLSISDTTELHDNNETINTSNNKRRLEMKSTIRRSSLSSVSEMEESDEEEED